MKSEKTSPTTKSTLTRQLTLFDSTMIMMGIVIASGIFLTTGIMAKSIPSAGLILAAWVVGGFLTLAGALSYAELGAAMPEAGGQYVYLSRAYGPMTGFLFGWVMFLVYNSGGIAAVSAAFAEYFGTLVPPLRADIVLFQREFDLLGISITPTKPANLPFSTAQKPTGPFFNLKSRSMSSSNLVGERGDQKPNSINTINSSLGSNSL